MKAAEANGEVAEANGEVARQMASSNHLLEGGKIGGGKKF